MASILSSSSQASTSQTAPSTSRALLMDLMELAEDGVTLTQCGRAATGPDGGIAPFKEVHSSVFNFKKKRENILLFTF